MIRIKFRALSDDGMQQVTSTQETRVMGENNNHKFKIISHENIFTIE